MRIADRLVLGPASSAEVAGDLGLPAAAIRSEMRKLFRAGLVDRVGRTSRRGVSEYLYSWDLNRSVMRPGELAQLPDDHVGKVHARLLRLLYGEATEAIEAGTFHARDEFALIRFVLPVSDRGWEEACLLHDDLGYSIIEAVEKAGVRIGNGSGEPIQVCVAVGLFEAPSPWPSQLSSQDEAAVSTRRAPRGHGLEAVAAIADPLRLRIIDSLNLGPASAGELAKRLGAPRETIRYELGRLREMGLTEIHSRRRRRGMEELLYVCESRKLVLGTDVVSSCDRDALDAYCRDTVAEIFRGSLAALKAGGQGIREEAGFGRIPGRIDPQAFSKISTLMTATLDRLFQLRDESMGRLAEGEEPRRVAISNLLFFERPESKPTRGNGRR